MSTNQRGSATIAALLFLAVAGGCSGGGDGGGGGGPIVPQTGSVAGQVSDGSAGVAGATVAVQGGPTTTTDGAGNFTLAGVTAGARVVTVTPPAGWITGSLDEPTSKTVTVAASQTATVGWTLKRGVLVTASGTLFSPVEVTISAGETVRWRGPAGEHTVTPDDASQPGAWASAALGSAGFEHTFTVADSYPYHCIPHVAMGMTGTVTVEP